MTFIDPTARRHDALVTAIHGDVSVEARNERNKAYYEEFKGQSHIDEAWLERANSAPWLIPSINLVFVTSDGSKTDSYGRQIDRATSVPHESTQTAHGYKYEFV